MEFLNDLILRYAVMLGKRFWPKQKITFLRTFSKEVSQLGYHLDARLARLQLGKRRYQNYYNAYIGDLEKADIIFCTYYDTGINRFNLTSKYAFDNTFTTKQYLTNLLPIIVTFLLSLILNIFFLIPSINLNGFFSLSGFLSFASIAMVFFFIVRYHRGIPNKNNFVCNSSSLILFLNLMKKQERKNKNKIAFALLDGGTTNNFGLRMLESYSKSIDKKKLFFIDCIGNGDEIQLFKPNHCTINLENTLFYEGYIDTRFNHYCLMTSGKRDKLNRVRIVNANSSRDNTLSLERIEKHTQTILALCQKLSVSDRKSISKSTRKVS